MCAKLVGALQTYCALDQPTFLADTTMPPDNALPGDLHVPIINLGKSYSCVESRTEVAEEIRKACLSSGFFYVTSHGIPNGICEGILDHAAKLFKTAPFSEKQRIHIQHSPHGYGWEPAESTSIAGDMELKEAYNWSYSEDLDPTGGDGLYVQLDALEHRT